MAIVYTLNFQHATSDAFSILCNKRIKPGHSGHRGGIDGASKHRREIAPTRWVALREAALDFLDRFGAEAVRFGWTASELFGVHAEHGTLRLDHCGALMITGRKATGLEPTRILLGNQSAHRDRPGKVYGPPVWVFAAKGER